MSDERPVLILTTAGSADEANRIAHELVQRRLAACVNIVDRVRSVYRWEEAVSVDDELLLVIKTRGDAIAHLRDHLLAMHSYEVPEFVVLPVAEVSEAYGRWLVASCERDRPTR